MKKKKKTIKKKKKKKKNPSPHQNHGAGGAIPSSIERVLQQLAARGSSTISVYIKVFSS